MILNKVIRPLSPSENWYISRYEENPDRGKLSIVPMAMNIGMAIPISLVEQVIKFIIDRNEIFRTEYLKTEDTIACIYDAGYANKDGLIDYQNMDLTDHVAIFENECLKGIPIYEHTYRIIIYNDEVNGLRMLLMIFHHLVFDWDSIYLLHNQLAAVMKHLTLGSPLPEVGKYSDYAAKIASKLTETKKQQIHDYWTQLLSEKADSVFEPDLSVPSDDMGVFSFTLDEEQRKFLKTKAREYRSSEFIILFAITGIALKNTTGKTSFIINTPYSNRYFMCEKPTIGVMLYSTVIRFTSEALGSFEACVAYLKQNLAKAFDNQPVNLNYLQKLIRENNNELQLFYNHQFHQPAALESNSMKSAIKTIPLFTDRELTKSISPFAMETLATDQSISIRISYQRRYVSQSFLTHFKNDFISHIP